MIIDDSLIFVGFPGKMGGLGTKIETSASAFRGRGSQYFAKLRTHVDGGRRGSYFRGFFVDVINVCSLTMVNA